MSHPQWRPLGWRLVSGEMFSRPLLPYSPRAAALFPTSRHSRHIVSTNANHGIFSITATLKKQARQQADEYDRLARELNAYTGGSAIKKD